MNSFKKWGLVAGAIYLLSLPIAIWKSSKIGKIIFLTLGVIVLSFAINKISDAFFKTYQKFIMAKELKSIKNKTNDISFEIEILKKAVDISKSNLEIFDLDLKEGIKNIINEVKNELEEKLKFQEINGRIEEIEKALNIIREEERQALKEKIIVLKEQVKLEQKSINSKEIRMAVEEIAERTYLLKPEEKERFLNDLREIGFTVNKVNDRIDEIQSFVSDINGNQYQSWGICSAETVTNYIPQVKRRRVIDVQIKNTQ